MDIKQSLASTCTYCNIQELVTREACTRPPLRRFPLLGGVCNPGAGALASPLASPPLSGLTGEPTALAEAVAVAGQEAMPGSKGICTGAAAAALAGSAQNNSVTTASGSYIPYSFTGPFVNRGVSKRA